MLTEKKEEINTNLIDEVGMEAGQNIRQVVSHLADGIFYDDFPCQLSSAFRNSWKGDILLSLWDNRFFVFREVPAWLENLAPVDHPQSQ